MSRVTADSFSFHFFSNISFGRLALRCREYITFNSSKYVFFFRIDRFDWSTNLLDALSNRVKCLYIRIEQNLIRQKIRGKIF